MALPNQQKSRALDIELLIRYALRRGLITCDDEVYVRNALLGLLRIEEPLDAGPEMECVQGRDAADSLDEILGRLCDHAVELGLIPENTTAYRDLFDTKVMGLLTPRPSEVVARFTSLESQRGVTAATDWFYDLSGATNYIRLGRIAKDRKWSVDTPYGRLQLTINLAKPEKDPRDIAAARAKPPSAYPKCVLCVENVGYAGRVDHPARQNLRVIPLRLRDEQWYMQYSPYVYYNEHCIVLKREHVPMKIDRMTFERLLDFVDRFPHYFIGSNADLPIVGGSILSHDHFQGGRHKFPMDDAGTADTYVNSKFPDTLWKVLEWPLSTVRIVSTSRRQLVAAADCLLGAWIEYSDESVGVRAFGADGQRHNTVTAIARRAQDGEYELDVVLRNNRTSPEYPLGIFHPHADLHHIKKENIGLIEVMGLAILPGRLLGELQAITEILTGKMRASSVPLGEEHPLAKHRSWIDELVEKYGATLDEDEAMRVLEEEVGVKFQRVLEDCGVFKRNSAGREAFRRFMSHVGAVAV
jgi:UDPglucose--hexose-1-phosphate uridylyltransferase